MFRLSQITLGFLLVVVIWGQSFSGKIVGIVTDPTGGVVPRVSVTMTNEGTGAQRRLTTDNSGVYVAAELTVGYYTVRFEARGLSPVERQHVKVDVASETRTDSHTFATDR